MSITSLLLNGFASYLHKTSKYWGHTYRSKVIMRGYFKNASILQPVGDSCPPRDIALLYFTSGLHLWTRYWISSQYVKYKICNFLRVVKHSWTHFKLDFQYLFKAFRLFLKLSLTTNRRTMACCSCWLLYCFRLNLPVQLIC